MKKLILSVFLLLGLAFSAQSQEFSKNAIGLRLGGDNGFGTEISYQRGLSKDNRLELNLGWRNDSNDIDNFKLVGLYQWVWGIDKGFNWYAGVGGGIGSWSYNGNNNNFNNGNDSGIILLAAGDIGIEYNFDIPIQIALDFRPQIYLNAGDYRNDDFGGDIAFSIRYCWN
ncbi:hypothetical protein WFZ85_01365 [Flavobacterium sp. j3]|uniref:Outer membrane protein beta-barrel domain-containing protein n=1 Tax=Flavobacterium aureirubrum TaxID=3133147 RepID=A0ABU9N360_9FLAO